MMTFHSRVHWACIRKLARYFDMAPEYLAVEVATVAGTGGKWHEALRTVRDRHWRLLTGERRWPVGKTVGRTT